MRLCVVEYAYSLHNEQDVTQVYFLKTEYDFV